MREGKGTPVPQYPYKDVLPAPVYWLYRLFRLLTVAFAFGGFWLGTVAVGWLLIPIVVLWPGTREVKFRRALGVVRRGFQFFHWWMRVLRLYHRTSQFTIVRPDGRPADTPVVLVANHPTVADTTSIISLFPNVVAVTGAGFDKNPFIGRVLRLCGFVPVGTKMIPECMERLRMGLDVLIFPEGTRSPANGGLQPFHRGAFELAARAKVPIVLLKLTCSPPALSKRRPIWKHPDRMPVLTIEPFDTIHPADGDQGSKATARAIEQRYYELLGYGAPAVAASEPHPLGGVQ